MFRAKSGMIVLKTASSIPY